MRVLALLLPFCVLIPVGPVRSAPPASRPAGPGDRMIHAWLARLAGEIHDDPPADLSDRAKRDAWRRELAFMLALPPESARGPLHATVTGTLTRDGYVVDKLHYQSLPGLYVTANLYRPANAQIGYRHPAILYLCGHSERGRNGNKTSYQSHGIWFARHGYVCLTIDSLQLGEIAGIHHGTYREGRPWWVSLGYTPAGVECWNGMRGIDYLVSRQDVDPGRIGVTGISGGGSYTVTVSALDDRVKVSAPVSGISDLAFYVTEHGVDWHCDCMFMHNLHGWPWSRLLGLIAPRPLLVIDSDQDRIFPLSGHQRLVERMRRVYAAAGAPDRFESLVSSGGHAYREDIRAAVYRFMNTHLKNDPRPVADGERDLVGENDSRKTHPIAPEDLRVFPRDEDIPADQLNTTIDRHFVPTADMRTPEQIQALGGEKAFLQWKVRRLLALLSYSFRPLPIVERSAGDERAFEQRFPPAREAGEFAPGLQRLQSEEGISFGLKKLRDPADGKPARILLALTGPEGAAREPAWLAEVARPADAVYLCEPRGYGQTRWDETSPPNTIARTHVLLGRTPDAGRMLDAGAAARYLREKHGGTVPVHLAGRGAAGVIAAYAALWDGRDIAGVTVIEPPKSHLEKGAPVILNVLRVTDVPEALGLIAPNELTLIAAPAEVAATVEAWYRLANAADKLTVRAR
ncbi:MAG: prolyl oligopeptidase family serine peptidase [Phycisphaerae bacterium]|jgi:hypothetical protein